MTKIITGEEMQTRLLEKLNKNITYGGWNKVQYHPVPIRFERCEDNYGWMTEVDMRQYKEIHQWCFDTFDIDDWVSGYYYFWLKDARMVTLFCLRWS